MLCDPTHTQLTNYYCSVLWCYVKAKGESTLKLQTLITHPHTLSDRVGAYLSHTLLHSHCHRTLTSTLSLGVGVVNKLLSNQQGPPPVLIESLKLTFEIITELLHSSTEVSNTASHFTQPHTSHRRQQHWSVH